MELIGTDNMCGYGWDNVLFSTLHSKLTFTSYDYLEAWHMSPHKKTECVPALTRDFYDASPTLAELNIELWSQIYKFQKHIEDLNPRE